MLALLLIEREENIVFEIELCFLILQMLCACLCSVMDHFENYVHARVIDCNGTSNEKII